MIATIIDILVAGLLGAMTVFLFVAACVLWGFRE